MLPESRLVAELLLKRPTLEQWDAALVTNNLLQKSPSTAVRQARLIRKRLETLDDEGLRLIIDGDGELAGQILMAACARNSQLLSDFMRDVYAVDLRHLEKTLSYRQWEAFLADCAHRDEAVNGWTASTRKKLFQVIARILAEARYLDSTRHMKLTPPLLHPRVRGYLRRLGDDTTLGRMEVTT